jgi:hypothetical protein
VAKRNHRGGLEGKGKVNAVEKRKRPVSEADSKARKQKRGEEVGGEGAGGGSVKNKRAIAKCPHNRERSKCKQCGGSGICEHNADNAVQEMRRCSKLPAEPSKELVQAMRRAEHLRAQPHKKTVQGTRRVGHLRAQPQKKHVQAMRPGRGGHLREQSPKEKLQAVRRVKHLRAQPPKKQVREVLQTTPKCSDGGICSTTASAQRRGTKEGRGEAAKDFSTFFFAPWLTKIIFNTFCPFLF